jgi:hypothetical protein
LGVTPPGQSGSLAPGTNVSTAYGNDPSGNSPGYRQGIFLDHTAAVAEKQSVNSRNKEANPVAVSWRSVRDDVGVMDMAGK